MTTGTAQEVGTAALSATEKGTSYEGRSRPNKIRLMPRLAADLRYFFTEIESEMGIRSVQGGHQDALLRGAFKLPKERKKKAPKPKNVPKGMSQKDRELAALVFTREEIAKLPGAHVDPLDESEPTPPLDAENAEGRDVYIDSWSTRVRGTSTDDGLDEVGVDAKRTTFHVVVEIAHPRLSAEEKSKLLRPTYTVEEAAVIDPSLVRARAGADGCVRSVYPGVEPRRMPPSDGTTVFPIPCKDEGSEDCNRLEDVERWTEAAMPASAGSMKRERMHRCRAALVALERTAPLYLVALYRAYGPRDQHARDDLWDRDVASLVAHTPAARALRDEKVAHALKGREGGIQAATFELEFAAARRVEAAREAIELSRAAIVRREVAIANSEIADARRDAELETLLPVVAPYRPGGGGDLSTLNAKQLGALSRDATRLAKLERMRAGRDELRGNRLASLAAARAALAEEQSMLARLEALAPAQRAPAMEDAMVLAIDREIRVEDVLREALQAFPPAPPGGETPVAKRDRIRRQQTHRTDFIDQLGKEAEQILISASNAYRRALAGVGS